MRNIFLTSCLLTSVAIAAEKLPTASGPVAGYFSSGAELRVLEGIASSARATAPVALAILVRISIGDTLGPAWERRIRSMIRRFCRVDSASRS